jgi:hypothetical protein
LPSSTRRRIVAGARRLAIRGAPIRLTGSDTGMSDPRFQSAPAAIPRTCVVPTTDIAEFLAAGRKMLPELAALYRLWEARRAARLAPARHDLSLEDLKPWLGHLLVIDVIDRGADFVYRVYGTAIGTFFGNDLTGKRLSEVDLATQEIVGQEYRAVVAIRRPTYTVRSPRTFREDTLIARANLPLSHGGQAVDQLLVGIYHFTSPV